MDAVVLVLRSTVLLALRLRLLLLLLFWLLRLASVD
jgi:hypothetical protein